MAKANKSTKHLQEKTFTIFLGKLKANGWDWYPLMEYALKDSKIMEYKFYLN